MTVQAEDPEGQKALAVVGHGAEELKLQVQAAGVFVEQPPQAARQVLHSTRYRKTNIRSLVM